MAIGIDTQWFTEKRPLFAEDLDDLCCACCSSTETDLPGCTRPDGEVRGIYLCYEQEGHVLQVRCEDCDGIKIEFVVASRRALVQIRAVPPPTEN